MLTPEQIKNLKPGDPIVINTTFIRFDADGDIHFKAPAFNGAYHGTFISRDYVSLPSDSQSSIVNSQSKYDPCRLFKKGDLVRIKREINGRKLNHVFVNFSYDQTYTVVQDEEQKEHQSGLVKIANETGCTFTGSFYELELITPVEELYEVECDDDEKEYSVTWRDKFVCTFPYDSDSFYTKEQAKAAAEAERDRLNAEYRKEQK